MRRSYVVSMRWMVMYEYEVPGEALNLSSTKLPRQWSPWESSPSRKNPHYATSWKVPGSIPSGVTEDFFRGIRQFHVPGVDSAS
jgi:hypothetical protein